MGKLNIFRIVFDHPQRVYFPGQWVTGKVIVSLKESMKMRGIRMKFKGQALVQWSESSSSGFGRNRRTTSRTIQSKENYFQGVVAVVEPLAPNQGKSFVLAAGHYEFPFQYRLRENLPSSFESIHGHVRYTAAANIDKPWKFDHVTREAFTVVGVLDLNREDLSLREPCTLRRDKSVSCFCLSGRISAIISINKRCFVPGEAIYVSGEIYNNSHLFIRKTTALLIQKTRYYANGRELACQTFEIRCEHPSIEPGLTDIWNNVPIMIPSLPPSRLDNCQIIDITYFFKFDVDVCGHFAMNTEVIVGTIPLYGTFAVPQSPAGIPGIDHQPAPSGARSELPSGSLDLPPPSYEECVVGKFKMVEEGDTKFLRGDQNWTPMYPKYQLLKSSPSTAETAARV